MVGVVGLRFIYFHFSSFGMMSFYSCCPDYMRFYCMKINCCAVTDSLYMFSYVL